MFLNLLLLFCCISYSGMGTEHVTGTKGGNATLSCDLEDHEISDIVLSRQAKHILVCNNDECKSVNDSKVFKKGSCDIVLKNLSYSDSGKYLLRVHYNKDQTEADKQVIYYLHIHDDISVKIDEKVKLHVLLTNADKVEHQYINSSKWTELWKRGDEVHNDRLNISEETLIINKFTSNDTGTYRVLDSNNETLITVTVTITESSEESKGEDNGTEQHKPRIIVGSVIGALVVLALVISAVIYGCWCRKREHERVPPNDIELQPI